MMFQNRENSGFHLICDIQKIEYEYNFQYLYDMMEWIVCLLDLKILNVVSHQFENAPDPNRNSTGIESKSFTILFLLGESHMSIHTYPEMDYIAFDLYTCRNYTDDDEYKKVVEFMIYYLDCYMTYDILIRGK